MLAHDDAMIVLFKRMLDDADFCNDVRTAWVEAHSTIWAIRRPMPTSGEISHLTRTALGMLLRSLHEGATVAEAKIAAVKSVGVPALESAP